VRPPRRGDGPAGGGRALRASLLVLALGLAGAAASCGYRLGPAAPLAGATTVRIPVFENRTYRRGVETDLARQIVSSLASRSRLRPVDEGGDLVVEGVITEVQEDLLSAKEPEQVRESALFVTVLVTVRDGRSGEPVVKMRRITERESFVPDIGESVRTARVEALKRLAEGVVDLLEDR
jgi:hypothetical protein